MIPYGRQSINQTDLDAVLEVLRSEWLTQGPSIKKFEKKIEDYCGVKHAVAVSNGTAALHIACQVLGLGSDDTLWTVPNTFVASANCALYCGAKVDFVDIDPDTLNLSISALEKKLIDAKRDGVLPKVLVAVHFAGQSCDMRAIRKLADEYGFYVIEDASHAIGGKYHDDMVGACRYADISTFSFHPVKIITTGEGGMILTNNGQLAHKARLLATHGITRDPEYLEKKPEGQWYYQQIDLGYNYRITDMQAALGIAQMSRIDEFVAKRHELAERYNHAFKGLPLSSQKQSPGIYSAYHLYVIKLSDQCRQSRKVVFDHLRESGIGVNVHYIPVHLQPYYQRLGFKQGDFPEAEKYYESAITLPLYPGLSEQDQDYVIQKLSEAII